MMKPRRSHQPVINFLAAAALAVSPALYLAQPKNALETQSNITQSFYQYLYQSSSIGVGKNTLPGVLSEEDIHLYQQAVELERQRAWEGANAVLAQIDNKILHDSILAKRYLSRYYTADVSELNAWLERNAEHPLATSIAALAARKSGGVANDLPEIPKQQILQGYGDSHLSTRPYRPASIDESVWQNREGAKEQWDLIEKYISKHALSEAAQLLASQDATVLSAKEIALLKWEMAEQYFYRGDVSQAYNYIQDALAQGNDMPSSMYWVAGLSAWKLNKPDQAAHYFSAMAQDDALAPWDDSAAAYWAYRAYKKIGNNEKAQSYLNQAAEHPRNFYGVLAKQALGEKVFPEVQETTLNEEDTAALYGIPAVSRAVAFVQIGDSESAEKELRSYFLQADKDVRMKLCTLTERLSLPSVQMSMASVLVKQGEDFESKLYPVPDWQPDSGFGLDPSLVFALARQESGFHTEALSPSGALGVMQLMPNTAKLMRKSLSGSSIMPEISLFEPEENITLGQHYLEHLMNTSIAGDNLFYLFAAYNAGPGRLMEWKRTDNSDPLLFLESMPYSQTRAYVKQVMANYWIYQELQGKQPTSAQALLQNQWPLYQTPSSLAANR